LCCHCPVPGHPDTEGHNDTDPGIYKKKTPRVIIEYNYGSRLIWVKYSYYCMKICRH